MDQNFLYGKSACINTSNVIVGWCESARFQILRFSEILPDEWVPGGIIILTRETKIAEMKLSEPYKNDFQLSKKLVQKKLTFFASEVVKIRKFREILDLGKWGGGGLVLQFCS